MTVSEKTFELLNEHGMSRKEFSEKTGIEEGKRNAEDPDMYALSKGDVARFDGTR